jgi:hypothetical protein
MGSGRSSGGARARYSCLRQPTRPASRRPPGGSALSTHRHKATAAMPRPDRRLARRRSWYRHPRPTGHAAIRRHRSGRPAAPPKPQAGTGRADRSQLAATGRRHAGVSVRCTAFPSGTVPCQPGQPGQREPEPEYSARPRSGLGETTRDRYAIRGYVSTAVKHSIAVFTAIRDALAGNPWIAAIPAIP